MRPSKILILSASLVFVALCLGVAIGYDVAPAATTTETLYATTTQTNVLQSGLTYRVYTVKAIIVDVYVYLPECVTTSGRTTTTYISPVGGQSTTIVYVYPTDIISASAVSFTTVTNYTATYSNRTQSESISC